LRPASPYAVSKIAQDYLGFQYSLSYKLPIIRVRSFNHIGPRQSPRFIAADFAKQIALIEKDQQEAVIKVGNLEAKRDFTDVRDVVRAYALLMEKGEKGEVYNIGSGISKSAQEILDMLLALSEKKITIQVDQSKMRPSDTPEIVCDHSKVTALTGWNPETPLEQTLKDTLEYWRKQVNT
jgi:GDP-4-dehydro-6-deoxy-D-mannose reductase